MLVGVTGTGFLGSHTVASIVRAGHQVRILARDESNVDAVLARLGVDRAAVQTRVGDVTDEVGVAQFVRGPDAVLHAAAVYSFDSRQRREMRRTNPKLRDLGSDKLRADLGERCKREVDVLST
jgi:nucleoside-diphosphate-sugar epimerase